MESSTEIAVIPDGPARQAEGESQPWSLERDPAAQHSANGTAVPEHNA
jgi:hypothetical protein